MQNLSESNCLDSTQSKELFWFSQKNERERQEIGLTFGFRYTLIESYTVHGATFDYPRGDLHGNHLQVFVRRVSVLSRERLCRQYGTRKILYPIGVSLG